MEFVETSIFSRQITILMTDDEYRDLQELLIGLPSAGRLIPGGNGLRKLRVAKKRTGKGKRGGMRIIYYQMAESILWMLYAYDKSNTQNLTKDQIRSLSRYVSGGVL